MKKLLIVLFSLISSLLCSAQTMIIFTNAPPIVIITNVFPVTIVNAPLDKTLKPIASNNIIDPTQSQYLGALITQPTLFIVSQFPTNYFQCSFYYHNPGNFKMDFQAYTAIKWMNGPAPTTNTDGCILFENVLGQLRATQ